MAGLRCGVDTAIGAGDSKPTPIPLSRSGQRGLHRAGAASDVEHSTRVVGHREGNVRDGFYDSLMHLSDRPGVISAGAAIEGGNIAISHRPILAARPATYRPSQSTAYRTVPGGDLHLPSLHES